MHAILLVTFALFSETAQGSDEVTAALLDGRAIAGVLTAWDTDQVQVVTTNGDQRIGAKELISLRRSPQPDAEKPAPAVVELTDGTVIPASQVLVMEKTATLTPELPTDRPDVIKLPIQHVAAVRLQPLEPPIREQWEEIRAQNLASDVLVVFKRDGKSVDYVEGVLGDVTSEKIEFQLEGDSLRVDRAKAAGYIYYHQRDDNQREANCAVHGRSGLLANAAKVRLANGNLHLTTVAGAEFDWPLGDVNFADFSAGKIAYLSDIDQSTVRWTPVITLPGIESAAKYGQPRRDQSAYGGPLSLVFRDDSSPAGVIERKTFGKGLAVRSRTEMTFRLPAAFSRFVATAGIDPASSTTGNVRLLVSGDDKTLLDAAVSGDQPPREIDLDIAGVKRLKIVVDYGDNLDTGDWINLCDARVIK